MSGAGLGQASRLGPSSESVLSLFLSFSLLSLPSLLSLVLFRLLSIRQTPTNANHPQYRYSYPHRTLVHAFPEAGLGVTVATDGCIYQSEVFTASTPPLVASSSSGRGKGVKGAGREKEREKGWGGRGVLVLVGIRLGLDGVNPVYYETIKVRSFPPSLLC